MSDIFATAIASKKQQEAELAARREQEQNERRAQEAARREQAAADRRQRELREAAERIKASIAYFRDGFFRAVIKAGSMWSSTTMEMAGQYCAALVAEVTDSADVPVPMTNLSTEIKKVIHGKFAYGIMLAGDRIPTGCLVGTRQDWFEETFAVVEASKTRMKSEDKVQIVKPTITIPEADSVDPTPPVKADDNVVNLRPAITAPSKKSRKAPRVG